ncbi:MAG: transcription termination/antitermination protein NusG [Pirellulaceae bacterium]
MAGTRAGAGESARADDNAGGDDAVDEDHDAEDHDAEDHDAEDHADSDDDVEPLELIAEPPADEDLSTDWYILKVQVNREDSIRDALQRRVKIEGFDRFFKEIVVPTEDVAEFTKTGKRRIVKRKLYPGYIMVNMHINEETWFLVRETPGIGDFTGSAGKPTPMNPRDVERILHLGKSADESDTHVKTAIPFRQGDRVRVKEGYFQNFEGDVESVDEANGRVTVMINIFGRSTPVELEHWQIEAV